MLRACVFALCSGAVYLLMAASPGSNSTCPEAASGSRLRPAANADLSCKPEAFVEVQLTEAGTTSGSQVDLEWSVRPQRTMKSVTWELRLPNDAVLLEGLRVGAASSGRGELTRGVTSTSVPVDGFYRQATLTVRGTFEGSDETGATFDEPFEVIKHLSWGEVPPVGPSVLSREAVGGELTTMIALPTVHREGR